MTTAPPQENAGLTSLVETVVAPASAFDRLAEKQTWGWAFIAASVFTIVASLAAGPVQQHIARLMMERGIAAAANAQQAAAMKIGLSFTMKFSEFAWVFSPIGIFISVGIVTVILLLCNALLGGKATFKQLWCASMNVFAVVSIGSLIASIVLALRGPDAFTSEMDVFRNSLSLAAVIPTANVKLVALLAAFTPFTLWALWLNALLMQRIARLAAPKAWAAALVVLLIPALLGAGFARQLPAASNGTPPTTSASASP